MKHIKEHMLLSIPQVAEATGTTRQAVWRNVQRGSLMALKVGNRYIVPYSELVRMQQRRKVAA